MQIFSAYKKVERGGVRTLAFLHSFACFFIYLFFTSDILQFAQQICLFVLIFIVLNWENIVTSCTVQLCQLASCYEWKCSSSSIYHFFWHTWNTNFFSHWSLSRPAETEGGTPAAPDTLWRRYSEFELLRTYLLVTYPYIIIPPLPEKRVSNA